MHEHVNRTRLLLLIAAAGLLAVLALIPPAAAAEPPAAVPGETSQSPRIAAVPPAAARPPLTPAETDALDRLLAAWERRSGSVQTWSCTFYKWEYNAWSPPDEKGDRLAFSESTGEIKYAAPDKGLYKVTESRQWNPEARRYEPQRGNGEHWVCNGTSIYEFRHAERQLRETVLPLEMQGRAISDGPLPFVFGARADKLKARYSMRIITPPQVADQVWLEAVPRWQADAANFSRVELILSARDLMPFAMQIYKPGGQDRDVYQFDPKTSLIDKGLDMIRDFSRPMTPLGYTFIREDLEASGRGGR
jgi:TIGR03009 family protein